jgi:hypothetical protein
MDGILKYTIAISKDTCRIHSIVNKQQKGKKMTVAELIQVLQTMPQHLVVDIGMNQEYQYSIDPEDVRVDTRFEDDQEYLLIGD